MNAGSGTALSGLHTRTRDRARRPPVLNVSAFTFFPLIRRLNEIHFGDLRVPRQTHVVGAGRQPEEATTFHTGA
jgi:hypothetical protein